MKKFGKNDVSTHVAVDNSDPGFAIKGHVLRWQSNHVAARKAGRIWEVLKASQLPDDTVGLLKSRQYRWFSKDGDTVRKGDLVLSYAPIELVEQRRRDNIKSQNLNEAVLGSKVNHGNEMVSTSTQTKETVSKSEAAAFDK